MRRHFGDMLLERRRQLGISIQQVSNIVRIKPQIIEYFETGNFAAMPPRGYAQGMIASYARYLGLDPDLVVDAYFDALHEFEHGSGGRVGRFADAAADASPRSSNAPARYMMVNSVPQSRFAQRPPQAGYVSESSSAHEPMSSSRLRPAAIADSRRGPQRGYDPSLRSRTQGSSRTDPYGPDRRAPRGRYGDRRPVQEGRRMGERPDRGGYPPRGQHGDPRRPSGDSRRGRGVPRSRGDRGRGGSGAMDLIPSLDPKVLAAIGLGLIVLLVLGGFMLLRGCAPEPDAAGSAKAPVAAQVDSDPEEKGDRTSSDSDGGSSDSSAADSDEDGKTEEEPSETIVKVSLKEKGAVAWVEVKLDGKIVLGKQVVGPFEEQFKVDSQIDITTDTPSAVSIYKNGEKVRYDTKVSGVGKVSITAPKREEDEKVVDSDGDGTPDMSAEEARQAGLDVPDDSTRQDSE